MVSLAYVDEITVVEVIEETVPELVELDTLLVEDSEAALLELDDAKLKNGER